MKVFHNLRVMNVTRDFVVLAKLRFFSKYSQNFSRHTRLLVLAHFKKCSHVCSVFSGGSFSVRCSLLAKLTFVNACPRKENSAFTCLQISQKQFDAANVLLGSRPLTYIFIDFSAAKHKYKLSVNKLAKKKTLENLWNQCRLLLCTSRRITIVTPDKSRQTRARARKLELT